LDAEFGTEIRAAIMVLSAVSRMPDTTDTRPKDQKLLLDFRLIDKSFEDIGFQVD
jgi:hypothetical protein